MTKIIGVRFRNLGKIYHFDAGDLEIKEGDHVIVETARGVEYGRVMFDPRERTPRDGNYPLKEVIRVATPEDDQMALVHAQREKEAYAYCLKKIREHKLEMKLIAAECTFNNRIMFYFTAEGRVDFRLLVKDLASVFKTRIELRQVGVRDETKFLGGIGICGRALCCCTYLTDFVPVSIKMAKEQNLSLNQTKISGVCGRLMCCLKNEQDTYESLNKNLPSNGEVVLLPDGMEGVVQSVNVLRQQVRVTFEINDEKEIADYAVEDLVLLGRKKSTKPSVSEEDDQDRFEGKAEGRYEGRSDGKFDGKFEGKFDGKSDGRSDRRGEKPRFKYADLEKGERAPREKDRSQDRDRVKDKDKSKPSKKKKPFPPKERGEQSHGSPAAKSAQTGEVEKKGAKGKAPHSKGNGKPHSPKKDFAKNEFSKSEFSKNDFTKKEYVKKDSPRKEEGAGGRSSRPERGKSQGGGSPEKAYSGKDYAEKKRGQGPVKGGRGKSHGNFHTESPKAE